MAIVGKGIDAWRDAMWELRLESRKTTDTVRDPCWPSAPTPRPAASASSAPGSVRLPPLLPLPIIRHVPKDHGKPHGSGAKRGARRGAPDAPGRRVRGCVLLGRSRAGCIKAQAAPSGRVLEPHTVHPPVGFAVTPPRCIRRVPCSMNTRTYSLLRSTVSTCRKSSARIPAAWACRNCRQVGPERRGAGSMPAACRISQTVDRATVTPSLVSSPWMRRCPHSGFSFARRTTRRVMPGPFGARRACAACSCRICPRPACGARPAASLA
jgi:hypothetical protein